MKTSPSLTILAALCVAIIVPASSADILYTVTEIPSLPGPSGRPMVVSGVALNNEGQVVGYMSISAGPPQNPFITGPNGIGLHLLVPPPNNFISAAGLNDVGQVTVNSGRADNLHAFLSEPNGGALHPIGSLGPKIGTVGTAVNNRGQVTGYSPLEPTQPNQERHAFLTSANGGTLKDLGTFGGTFSFGNDLNDKGQVAGSSFLKGDKFWHAFLSEPDGGALHDLGTFGGTQSFGNGVNEAGQVAGFADLRGNHAQHAFLSGPDGGALLDLGTLGGTFSQASEVNDSGVVVGFSYLGGNDEIHPFVYTTTFGMQDLNDLIDPQLGIELSGAGDINNRGQILASGTIDGRGASFLLTPIAGVPDSGTTGLLLGCALAGLPLVSRISPHFRRSRGDRPSASKVGALL
jgi:probable HAF family extracellular repeat protein